MDSDQPAETVSTVSCGDPRPAATVEPPGGQAASLASPRTQGIRVDGRWRLVESLENLLSFGNLGNILDATLAATGPKAGERILDLGCGSGRLAILAHQAMGGAGEVHGLDATPAMVEYARRCAARAGARVVVHLGVAEALPFPDGRIDAVMSTFTFHHFPVELKRQALAEAHRVLRPGGRLVIADYGSPRGLVGAICSLGMRFNAWEYSRSQILGGMERWIPEAGFAVPERTRDFLGYIAVWKTHKPGSSATPASARLDPP